MLFLLFKEVKIALFSPDLKAARGHNWYISLHTLITRTWALFAVLLCVFILFCCLSVIPLILIRNVEVNEASGGYIEGIICQQGGE